MTSVPITSKAQSFHFNDYGLKLHIPPGALPADIEQCELLIKVGISGKFAFPQNTSLVSAVYWLNSKPWCNFSQPLKVEIQHCAMASQVSRLRFARCSKDNLPYTFEILEEGEFNSETGYGCIELQTFSLITQLLTWLPSLTAILREDSIKYRARLYYLWSGVSQREIHFVITKDLNTHATVRYTNPCTVCNCLPLPITVII